MKYILHKSFCLGLALSLSFSSCKNRGSSASSSKSESVETINRSAILQKIVTMAKARIAETQGRWSSTTHPGAEVYQAAVDVRGYFRDFSDKTKTGETDIFGLDGHADPMFYNMVSPSYRQLFDLLGMQVPIRCDPSTQTSPLNLVTDEAYLQDAGRYGTIPDPAAVLAKMPANVDEISAKMTRLISAYEANMKPVAKSPESYGSMTSLQLLTL